MAGLIVFALTKAAADPQGETGWGWVALLVPVLVPVVAVLEVLWLDVRRPRALFPRLVLVPVLAALLGSAVATFTVWAPPFQELVAANELDGSHYWAGLGMFPAAIALFAWFPGIVAAGLLLIVVYPRSNARLRAARV